MKFSAWLKSHKSAKPYRDAFKLAADMPKEVRVDVRAKVRTVALHAYFTWKMRPLGAFRATTPPALRRAKAVVDALTGKEIRL
jgi:hypothetical protein